MRLGVISDDDSTLTRDLDASLARAALERLDDAIVEADRDGHPIPHDVIDRLQEELQRRIDRGRSTADTSKTQEIATRQMFSLIRAMVQAEQEELLRLRDEEGLPDALVRTRLRELDLRLQALGTER